MRHVILLLLVSSAAAARESPFKIISDDAATSEVKEHPLRGNVHLLEGSGGNILVLADPQSALMVDAGIAISKDKIRSALEGIGVPAPKYLVNTHWHWDHTDGNEWVHAAGATIIAHPNTRKHMSGTTTVAEWDHTFPPWPAGALPTVLVSKKKTLHIGGESVVLTYLGPSHTDGDLAVYFERADVLALGDVWWNGFYPFIDKSHGGSIDGKIRAVNENLVRIKQGTLIVPGHGAPGNRSDLVEFRDMLVAVRDRVGQLKSEGRLLDETIAAKPTAQYDEKWGKGVIDSAFFTRIVYASLP
jgi:glyoxylase-like metal-dependent hydrolase (beta-lactamase superfamily II)